MKGKKTTVALAFLIVILLGVIGFKYSQMSGQSPTQASHKNSQVKMVHNQNLNQKKKLMTIQKNQKRIKIWKKKR